MTVLPERSAFVDFRILGDERGSLIAIEQQRDINFAIKRVYYIYGTAEGTSRGFHAHRELQQFAICISGSCTMVLDDGSQRISIPMNKPSQGIYIDPMVWHEMMDFSPGSILLVLASDYYEEADYIRDYAEFQQIVVRQCGDSL